MIAHELLGNVPKFLQTISILTSSSDVHSALSIPHRTERCVRFVAARRDGWKNGHAGNHNTLHRRLR